MKEWHKQVGNELRFVEIHPQWVVSGVSYGNPHTDAAGTVSLEEFLAGKFQDFVRDDFGDEVLAEVIAAVEATIQARGHVAPK